MDWTEEIFKYKPKKNINKQCIYHMNQYAFVEMKKIEFRKLLLFTSAA